MVATGPGYLGFGKLVSEWLADGALVAVTGGGGDRPRGLGENVLYAFCRVLQSHSFTAGAVPWRSKLGSCWAPVQDGDNHGTSEQANKRTNDETRE